MREAGSRPGASLRINLRHYRNGSSCHTSPRRIRGPTALPKFRWRASQVKRTRTGFLPLVMSRTTWTRFLTSVAVWNTGTTPCSQGHYWAAMVQGERQPFLHVPYFFSDVFDLSYELWGDSEGATQSIVRGDLSSSSFSIWWLKGDRLVAAFVMNRPDEERQCAPEWIKSKQTISVDRLKDQNRSIKEAI